MNRIILVQDPLLLESARRPCVSISICTSLVLNFRSIFQPSPALRAACWLFMKNYNSQHQA